MPVAADRVAQDREPALDQRTALAARQRRFERLGDGDRGKQAVAMGDLANRVDLRCYVADTLSGHTRTDHADSRRQLGLYLIDRDLCHAITPVFGRKAAPYTVNRALTRLSGLTYRRLSAIGQRLRAAA